MVWHKSTQPVYVLALYRISGRCLHFRCYQTNPRSQIAHITSPKKMIILPFVMLCFCQYIVVITIRITILLIVKEEIVVQYFRTFETLAKVAGTIYNQSNWSTTLETPTFLVQNWVLDIRDKFHANQIRNSIYFYYFNFLLFS